MKYIIHRTKEYREWYDSQIPKVKWQIDERLSKIERHGYFGDHRFLDDIWELKWENGRRIYYAFTQKPNILFLLGGLKNAQKKDIKKARLIIEKYCF